MGWDLHIRRPLRGKNLRCSVQDQSEVLRPCRIARPRPHRRCRTPRPDLGVRWPSRLVATAAEERLNIGRIQGAPQAGIVLLNGGT